jgi:hypothetical protein
VKTGRRWGREEDGGYLETEEDKITVWRMRKFCHLQKEMRLKPKHTHTPTVQRKRQLNNELTIREQCGKLDVANAF